jgi:hypothetical protein
MPSNLIHSAPDDVFVVSPVDEGVYFPFFVVMEEDPAFDAFAEEKIGGFGEQLFLLIQLFLFAVAFDE